MGEKKEEMGKMGKSGWSGHFDYGGYERYRKWDNNYPDWLITILKYVNTERQKEWIFEHDVSGTGTDSEEARRTTKIFVDKINSEMDILRKKYAPLDDALDELEKHFKFR